MLQPVEIEAGARDPLAAQIGQIAPGEVGAQVVAGVGDAGEQVLIEVLLEHLSQVRDLGEHILRHPEAVDRVDRPEGQHYLEGVQRQVGRLEAGAEAADVDDAVAHAAERLVHLDDRAAVAFHPVDLVLGPLLDPLLQLGLEVVLHQPRIDDRRRVPRGDPQRDGVGGAGAGASERHARAKTRNEQSGDCGTAHSSASLDWPTAPAAVRGRPYHPSSQMPKPPRLELSAFEAPELWPETCAAAFRRELLAHDQLDGFVDALAQNATPSAVRSSRRCGCGRSRHQRFGMSRSSTATPFGRDVGLIAAEWRGTRGLSHGSMARIAP